MGRRLSHGTPCVKLSAQLASEAFQRAQIWLSYNGQVQALLEFKSKHRQVDYIVGEYSITQIVCSLKSCVGSVGGFSLYFFALASP